MFFTTLMLMVPLALPAAARKAFSGDAGYPPAASTVAMAGLSRPRITAPLADRRLGAGGSAKLESASPTMGEVTAQWQHGTAAGLTITREAGRAKKANTVTSPG